MPDENNFSSDGRIVQLEHATQAIKLGTIILGIKTKFCALILIERKKDDILNENTNAQKMIKFNDSLCCVISGLTSDARFLIDQIQVKLENNFFVSNETPTVENCGKIILKLASMVEDGSEKKFFKNRPLGVAFLICGLDHDGLSLVQVDPAGILKKKEFSSLGSGQDESNIIIREGYRKNMSTKETLNLGKKVLTILTEQNHNFDQHEIYIVDNNFKTQA
jgi:20S proteasome subunit alpha 5